jgi:hypothetical protein
MMKRSLSAVVLTGLVTAMFAISTFADELSFFSPIAGSNPGISFAGVPSGGAPWVVKHALATLPDDGRLRVDVRRGFSERCCSDMVAATSGAVLLTSDGSAEIHAKLQVPSACFGTIILVRVAGVNGTTLPAPRPWIAASGSPRTPTTNEHDSLRAPPSSSHL